MFGRYSLAFRKRFGQIFPSSSFINAWKKAHIQRLVLFFKAASRLETFVCVTETKANMIILLESYLQSYHFYHLRVPSQANKIVFRKRVGHIVYDKSYRVSTL